MQSSHLLSNEDVLQISEIFSMPQHQQALMNQTQIQFQVLQKETNNMIFESIQHLKKMELKYFTNILDQISQNEEKNSKSSDVWTQTTLDQSINEACQTESSLNICQALISEKIQLSKNIGQYVMKQNVISTDFSQKKKCFNFCQSIITQQTSPKKTEFVQQLDINYQVFSVEYCNQGLVVFQSEECLAIAIKGNNKVMAAGCREHIKIFELKNKGQINRLSYVLTDHKAKVCSLQFMEKNNTLISGDMAGKIFVCHEKIMNYWNCAQVLKEGHSNAVNQIILNLQENIMISCSSDTKILVWKMISNLWSPQTKLTYHTSCVYGISLSRSQQMLASCEKDNQIIISEQSNQYQTWTVIQKIIVLDYGQNICFVGFDECFCFQPTFGKELIIFQKKGPREQFYQTSSMQLPLMGSGNSQFRLVYNKQWRLLAVKNGNSVCIIRILDWVILNSFSLENSDLTGTFDQDFSSIIAWDSSIQGFFTQFLSFVKIF